jgi:hypothetical protein
MHDGSIACHEGASVSDPLILAPAELAIVERAEIGEELFLKGHGLADGELSGQLERGGDGLSGGARIQGLWCLGVEGERAHKNYERDRKGTHRFESRLGEIGIRVWGK